MAIGRPEGGGEEQEPPFPPSPSDIHDDVICIYE
jgi:hypothetical protein